MINNHMISWCSKCLQHFHDELIFVFYAEIQDDQQKLHQNNFWGKLPVDSVDVMLVQIFVNVTLSHTVSETNSFLRFTQKGMMASENCEKILL